MDLKCYGGLSDPTLYEALMKYNGAQYNSNIGGPHGLRLAEITGGSQCNSTEI